MSKRSNRLRASFCKELEKWAKKKKKEHWYLTMKLVNWGRKPVLLGDRRFWSMVEGQIRFKAEKMSIAPEKVVKYLFDQENSKEWMSRFE